MFHTAFFFLFSYLLCLRHGWSHNKVVRLCVHIRPHLRHLQFCHWHPNFHHTSNSASSVFKSNFLMLTLLNLESDLHQLIFYNFAGSLQTTSSAWLDTLVIAAMSKCFWIISKSGAPCRWSEQFLVAPPMPKLYMFVYISFQIQVKVQCTEETVLTNNLWLYMICTVYYDKTENSLSHLDNWNLSMGYVCIFIDYSWVQYNWEKQWT